MRRRSALAALVALLAAVPARAASERVYRAGLLLSAFLAEDLEAFVAELRRLGYREGDNLVLDRRLVERPKRNAALAAELVALKPDVLIGAGSLQVEALKRATASIPIVFANTGDPVGLNIVESLARPGSNVTGVANYTPELAAKRVQLLDELLPGMRRVAMLYNPSNPISVIALNETATAAAVRSIELVPVAMQSSEELASALQSIREHDVAALIGGVDILIQSHLSGIIAFAAQQRLPTIFPFRRDALQGGLMAYGGDLAWGWKRAASFVDKILKGASPRELPVENPTTFNLVINLRAAKALGLAVPPSLLLRADEVIE